MLKLPNPSSKNNSYYPILEELQIAWIHNLAGMFYGTLPITAVRALYTNNTTSTPYHLGHYLELKRLGAAVDLTHRHAHTTITADALFTINNHLCAPTFEPSPPQGIARWRTARDSRHLEIDTDDTHWHQFSPPEQLPVLMDELIKRLNETPLSDDPIQCVAQGLVLHNELARIQPFETNNEQRFPLLIANIPLLRAGHAPLIIPAQDASTYIECRDQMIHTMKSPTNPNELWPDDYASPDLEKLFMKAVGTTTELLRNITRTHTRTQQDPPLAR